MFEWLTDLFGGDDTAGQVDLLNNSFGDEEQDPAVSEEQVAKRRQFLLSRGYAEPEIEQVLTLPDEEQSKLIVDLLKTRPEEKPDTSWAGGFGVDVPEGTPESIVQEIVKEQMRSQREPTSGVFRPDREQLSQSNPELAPYLPGMTDADISDYFSGLLEEDTQGQIDYKTREGSPKLKIVQDDAFARSGLKSGDTVCIRIP